MLDKIRQHAISGPDSIAYKIGDESISYRCLLEKADSYAEILRNQGNSPVMLYGRKSINTVVCILACIIAKRAYIPIDTSIPISRVENIISIAGVGLVLTDENIAINNIPCISLDDLQSAVISKADGARESDTAYIIFTSGTTGEPKGVPISNDNLSNFVSWISSLRPLCDYEKANVMNQAQFCFDLSVADLYYSLCNGHKLISYEADKGTVAEFIKSNDINVAVITPTFARLCLLDDKFCKEHCPSLKCIYFCGETLEKKTVSRLFQRFPNLRIINAYGPTEATSAVSASEITTAMLESSSSLPIGDCDSFATEIFIDNDEIILRGKSVFGGYINFDSKNAYNDGQNCYRTGDLGYIKDGKLYYVGRKDSQIKYKGYRIELGDIESNLMKIDGVIESAAIAKKDGNFVKAIWAYVVVDNNADETELKAQLSMLVLDYMVPKKIKIIDKMPINSNNKIDRRALEKL